MLKATLILLSPLVVISLVDFWSGGGGGGGHTKYYGNVNILGADGHFKPIRMILDTGNDVTLVTNSSARYLGFSPGMGTPLVVSGIKQGMVSHFEKVRTQVQLGDLTPVTVELAFALEPEGLQENLLGNKDILSSGKYEFRFDHDSVTIIDRVNACDNTMAMAEAKSRYSNHNKVVDSDFWTNYYSQNFY